MTTSGPDPSGGADFRVAYEQLLSENDHRLVEVQRQLQSLGEVSFGEAQLLGVDDFDWGQAALVRYESIEDQVIVVPGAERHQTPTERIYLVPSYRPSDDQVRGLVIQLYERDNEQVTDHYRVHFADPGRRPIVGMLIDETSNEAQPIVHPEIDLAGQPEALDVDWTCVRDCLRNEWRRLPRPIVVVCGVACGACVFGRIPLACPGCVACLRAYAIRCIRTCS